MLVNYCWKMYTRMLQLELVEDALVDEKVSGVGRKMKKVTTNSRGNEEGDELTFAKDREGREIDDVEGGVKEALGGVEGVKGVKEGVRSSGVERALGESETANRRRT